MSKLKPHQNLRSEHHEIPMLPPAGYQSSPPIWWEEVTKVLLVLFWLGVALLVAYYQQCHC